MNPGNQLLVFKKRRHTLIFISCSFDLTALLHVLALTLVGNIVAGRRIPRKIAGKLLPVSPGQFPKKLDQVCQKIVCCAGQAHDFHNDFCEIPCWGAESGQGFFFSLPGDFFFLTCSVFQAACYLRHSGATSPPCSMLFAAFWSCGGGAEGVVVVVVVVVVLVVVLVVILTSSQV